jgi:anti-anti-sigma factor
MSQTLQTSGDAQTVVCVDGDLTASRVGALRTQVKGLIASGARNVVIDMAKCYIVDSSGIGLLVAAHNSLSAVKGVLSLVHVSQDLRDLFQTMRLQQHFSIAA